ncbi:MAG: hypothetical protein JXA78_08030 [Anaerolineales bacterium]|nr:hypothetical protein [Anaerolineales bacterium]
MPSAEYDLWYLRDGIAQLESYLLSEEIYWPVGVAAPANEPPYPQLTLGNLLLSHQRAQALAQAPGQRAELGRLSSELQAMRSRWRSAWGRKAKAEFHARLNLWRDFLEEYRQSPQAQFDRYAYEIGRRATLHLLRPEADDLPTEEIEMLSALDAILRQRFVPGAFAWEPGLAPAFPQDEYWYLYGRLPH